MGTEWIEHFGIAEMDLPEITGKYSGNLLIVASGKCVWEDVEKVRFWDCDVLCVNDIGMHYPGHVTHWYSNDAVMLPRWFEARRPGRNKDIELHSCNKGVKWKWPWPGHSGSGLQSVYTGLALGYDEIIIAGMPSDDSGHYFDPPWEFTNFTREVPPQVGNDENRWWKNARCKMFGGKVTSLSGRTKEWLGSKEVSCGRKKTLNAPLLPSASLRTPTEP